MLFLLANLTITRLLCAFYTPQRDEVERDLRLSLREQLYAKAASEMDAKLQAMAKMRDMSNDNDNDNDAGSSGVVVGTGTPRAKNDLDSLANDASAFAMNANVPMSPRVSQRRASAAIEWAASQQARRSASRSASRAASRTTSPRGTPTAGSPMLTSDSTRLTSSPLRFKFSSDDTSSPSHVPLLVTTQEHSSPLQLLDDRLAVSGHSSSDDDDDHGGGSSSMFRGNNSVIAKALATLNAAQVSDSASLAGNAAAVDAAVAAAVARCQLEHEQVLASAIAAATAKASETAAKAAAAAAAAAAQAKLAMRGGGTPASGELLLKKATPKPAKDAFDRGAFLAAHAAAADTRREIEAVKAKERLWQLEQERQQRASLSLVTAQLQRNNLSLRREAAFHLSRYEALKGYWERKWRLVRSVTALVTFSFVCFCVAR
jgi:hypothetical protein